MIAWFQMDHVVERKKVTTVMVIGGILLYGPIEFWIFVSGSAVAFILLNLVSILHDRDCPLPGFGESITWMTFLGSWISATALAVIAVPLTYIVIRDIAARLWRGF